MKKKVFITGASGFVGSHLVEAAFRQGYDVHAAVRETSQKDAIAPFVSHFFYPNLSDYDQLKQIFQEQQYHYIVHAAAMTTTKSLEEIEAVSVGYTETVISAAIEAQMPLERIVYVSSLAALGPISYESDVRIDEDFPYKPLTVYGRSKMEAEQMIQTKFATSPITVFRPTAVYGPREKDIFMLFGTMNRGLDPYIGRKPQKLSFIYVKDLVDLLIKGFKTPGDQLQFYNVSDGEVYSRYAMAWIFNSGLKNKLWRVHVPYGIVKGFAQLSQYLYKNSKTTPVIYPERLSELTAENWACDISKARRDLNFIPKHDLESGLKESLLWYKENKWLN